MNPNFKINWSKFSNGINAFTISVDPNGLFEIKDKYKKYLEIKD